MSVDLDDLIERVRRGERNHFEAVIQACHVPVRALLSVLVHDRDDADDLAQQTFVFAYEHLQDYASGTNFLAWIKAIARQHAQDHRKRLAQRRGSQERFLRSEIARRASEIAGTASLDSRLQQLQECVQRLPDAQRSFLRDAHDRSSTLDDLARRLQRSAAAVRKQISRLYDLIRQCMDRRISADAAP
ncbi:MAG TPA: sigma-70 family RNA polymerase sigma factor [Planctomycetota bacterium]|nr:sigma-70 family RNA polymerase sigma factor [Planctomycetota bacterium]